MLKYLKFLWFVYIANMVEALMAKWHFIACIDVADIITEYGAYYEKSGQNKSRILKMMTQKTETTSVMTSAKSDETIYKFSQGTVSSLLQPFQKAWTAKGTVKFTPNEIRLHHMKMDFEDWPDDLEATWLGFLADNNLSRKEWPYIRYIIEAFLFPKLDEEKELLAYYKGVQKDPTTNVAGLPQDVMNGIGTLLKNGIASGKMNQLIGIGTLAADTIFDQVEDCVDQISEVYQGVPMYVCMSKKWRKAYLRDKRANGFYQIKSDKEIDESIDFDPRMVKGLASMNGSDDIWITPKSNVIHRTKKFINSNRFKVEESKRQVFVMTDWWEGIGFGIDEIVWTTASAGSGSI